MSFLRKTRYTKVVDEFLSEISAIKVWDFFPIDYTFCHTVNKNGVLASYFSTIDHFFIDRELLEVCSSASSIHLGDNLSNHQPIQMALNLQNVPQPSNDDEPSVTPKPAWYKATDNNLRSYKNDLQDRINNVNLPEDLLVCRDVHCTNPEHIDQCDKYCLDILEAISESVRDNIPMTGSDKQKKVITGWSTEVKQFQNEAKFYHALWISSGKPINTDLHWAMKSSRNQFHYAVRRAKRNEKAIINNKFVQACLNNDIDDLLKEVKNMRGVRAKNSTVIDGNVGDTNI